MRLDESEAKPASSAWHGSSGYRPARHRLRASAEGRPGNLKTLVPRGTAGVDQRGPADYVIHFVVVVGSPVAVDRLAPRLLPALDTTRLFDAEPRREDWHRRTWAVAAITAPDPTCPTRLAADDDAMIVMNGPALSARGDNSGWRRTCSGLRCAAPSAWPRPWRSYNFVGTTPSRGCAPSPTLPDCPALPARRSGLRRVLESLDHGGDSRGRTL